MTLGPRTRASRRSPTGSSFNSTPGAGTPTRPLTGAGIAPVHSANGAVSAGCVHADETTLRYLMRMTPLGTPVTVES